MKIQLESLSKRFNYEWIFRNLNTDFESGKAYAITGPNGSGKSTLIKIISGQLSPSEGKISYFDTAQIDIDNVYQYIAFAAPYVDLIDDFNLKEYLTFHFSFKKPRNNASLEDILQISGLEKHQNKSLKTFSSGMKQRVKLITAIYSNTEVLLLDEPTSNLDEKGVEWYLDLIHSTRENRIVIIGSNMEREYAFCEHTLQMSEYK